MKIRLIFLNRHRDDEELQVGATVKVFVAHASDKISAKFELEDNDKVDFPSILELQLGFDPDNRAIATVSPDVRAGDFHTFDKNKNQWSEIECRLFQGSLGTCNLYLIKGEEEWIRLAQVSVDDSSKTDRYDSMVKDLLDEQWAHFVIDDFNGQMNKDHFRRSWREGYCSTADPGVMLDISRDTLKKIMFPLISINHSPKMTFHLKCHSKKIAKLARLDARTIRTIGLTMAQRGLSNYRDASDLIISSLSKASSTCDLAHSVIFDFLKRFIYRRLDIVDREYKKRLSALKKSFNGMTKLLSSPTSNDVFKYSEFLKDRELYEKKLSEISALKKKALKLMALPIFAASQENITIFDVESNVFAVNDTYKNVYMVMLEYSRANFWWIGERFSPFLIPKLEIGDDNDDESRLQRKYSIVYENWCFLKMVNAMKKLGFELVKYIHNAFEENESVINFQRENIYVTLVHGFKAYNQSRRKYQATKEFLHPGGGVTPDFAIIINSERENDTKWIVIDAKSDDDLKPAMYAARNKYATISRKGDKPIATILFRSGKESDDPCIEVPPPLLGKLQVPTYLQTQSDIDDHSGDDYSWRERLGFIEGEDNMPPYHGHVRVNVLSLKKRNNIFSDFLEGMIATAIRIMQGSSS